MVWIYLIVQAVGLGIIAWCFKMEDRRVYATTFGMGGLFTLLLAVVVAPLPIKALTGLLIVLFRSKVNLTFSDRLQAILNGSRTILQDLSALASNGYEQVSHFLPESLSNFLSHLGFHHQQEQQPANVDYPNNTINTNIIDIEAIEVTHWL